MPIHNWKKVYSGIFHDFHQAWSGRIKESLNAILPPDYYAIVEQNTTRPEKNRFIPDILTLQIGDSTDDGTLSGNTAVLAPAPKATSTATSDAELYRRKKNVVKIRHVTKDRVVAMIELISPGNKSGKRAFREFLTKSCTLLERGIHLLIVDLFPPTPRDPNGIHSAIWEEIEGESQPMPEGKDRLAVSYECDGDSIQAYVEPRSLGESLPEMPVFLKPDGCVMLSLEETYTSAYATVPARWRKVIEG